MDFLKDGDKETEGIITGSIIRGLESALGVKSQDGEAEALGDEGLGKGLEVELGNSGLWIGWGVSDLKLESGVESNETGWEAGTKGAMEVYKKGKRWGKVIFEWGE